MGEQAPRDLNQLTSLELWEQVIVPKREQFLRNNPAWRAGLIPDLPADCEKPRS